MSATNSPTAEIADKELAIKALSLLSDLPDCLLASMLQPTQLQMTNLLNTYPDITIQILKHVRELFAEPRNLQYRPGSPNCGFEPSCDGILSWTSCILVNSAQTLPTITINGQARTHLKETDPTKIIRDCKIWVTF